jgi:hypothetical protein
MSIKQIWSDFKPEQNEISALLSAAEFTKTKSHSPLKKLKQKIALSIVLSILITVLYFIPLYIFTLWTFRLAMIIVLLTNVFLIFKSWQLYKSIEVNISPSASLKKHLQSIHTNFIKWQQLQQKIGVIIFPVATTGGFTLGLVMGSGKELSDFAAKPVIWIVLIITIILFALSGLWFTKKMFKLAYGKQLKSIEQNISELDNK